MTAPRLPEVVARVVAWHNRHPLARRIDASQVHSIGEVRLPFASAEPWGDAPPPPAAAPGPAAPPPADKRTAPTLAEALALRQARHAQSPSAAAGSKHSASARDDKKADAPPAADDTPAPEAADAPSQDPTTSADDDRAEAALLIPLLDGDDDEPAQPPAAPAAAPASAPGQAAAAPPAAAAPAEPPDDQPAPPDEAPTSALARAVERRAAARASGAGGEAAPDAETPPPGLAAPAPASRWRRLVDALRRLVSGRQPGLPPLRAVFSEDFAWPLRPGAVARWAQRHGRPEPLAPLDWPRRSIDIEPTRLAHHRGKGFVHDLPLHVLTAAIGVGDRRIRVLVAADGSIVGPRALDRQRSAAAATLLGLGLVALGWTLRPLHAPPADPAAVLAAAAAASAPPLPASAASAAHEAASATVAAASAPDAGASAAHAEPAEAHAANAASAPEPAASEPPGDIRPVLTDEQKYAAKVEAAKLRGEPPPPPPEPAGPVYAVISPGSPSPEVANRSLALMRAAAEKLDGGAPAHGELINSHGQWRAAWWPFASLVDAERARVLLAGRGVKAEVVEF